ncbi:hypothetical protein [Stenotrophomonas sp. 364]|uniref:hypothetical protein n=1 Tax=Stenotrophomonas sp. 364 TaxID=2691571 RepID=UPI001318DC77|nr:hypothetical protein [Stenotrophomonas sp. 364]QHB72499.1 hypothetical protein GQ674_14885 [Stenotrophomonas sp. 364]
MSAEGGMELPKKLEERMRLRSLRPDLEPLAQELYELSSAGSRELWADLSPERLKQDVGLRQKFYGLAHEGMYKAQAKIISRVTDKEPLDVSEILLFRGIMDSIAWAMIGGQLCYARRLYRGQKQPSLANSNFQSLVAFAEQMREREPGSMPLLSDLTSFIQVGDVMCVSQDRRISIVEVKEGEHNKKILDMIGFYHQSGCERFRHLIRDTESSSTAQQFERVLRQHARMEFVVDVMKDGFAHDPDSGDAVSIPEPTIFVESWDENLQGVIAQSQQRGWGYDVVGSIFMAAYTNEPWRRAGHGLFLSILAKEGDIENDFCIIRLADCMQNPLAPPIFSRSLSTDVMFDVLFGRMNVCVALSIPGLISECEEAGMRFRFATKKELAEARKHKAEPVIYQGKGLMFEFDGSETILLGGVLHRCLFHGQRPASTILAVLESSKLLDPIK